MNYKTIITVLLFLFSAFNIFSQAKDSLQPNMLNPGKWSIQFEVGSYVNPNFFENVMFSLKPQISKNFAVRASLSFDHSKSDGTDYGGSLQFPNETKSNYIVAKINLQYYFNPDDKAVFYFGLGPICKYQDYKDDYNDVSSSSYGEYVNANHRSYRTFSAGAIGLFGVEFFLIPRISILGEYNVSLMTGTYDYTSTYKFISPMESFTDVNETHNDTFEFQFNIVKLGISVYF